MKKIVVLFILFVLCATSVIADNLDQTYTPTRREWLKNECFQSIKGITDSWKLHIAFSVVITDSEVSVVLTS